MTSFPASGTGQIDKIKNRNTLLWNIPEFFLNFFLKFKAESFKLKPRPIISIQNCSKRS